MALLYFMYQRRGELEFVTLPFSDRYRIGGRARQWRCDVRPTMERQSIAKEFTREPIDSRRRDLH